LTLPTSPSSLGVRFETKSSIAGWSSLVARWAHNPKVVSSNLAPATIRKKGPGRKIRALFSFGDGGHGADLRASEARPVSSHFYQDDKNAQSGTDCPKG
jgi:hypothetical protein